MPFQPSSHGPVVMADNEWQQLRAVIVGRADHSCFPSEPEHMIHATMPEEHWENFRPDHPFDEKILRRANEELNGLAALLEKEGIEVYRPERTEWAKIGGYTAAMPRDGLLTVGSHMIEAPFAWSCRRHEIRLAFGQILETLSKDPSVRVIRAPPRPEPDSIYGHCNGEVNGTYQWAINNTRPAFDAADFMRLGKVLLGQYSNVTNARGVEWLKQAIPEGYAVEMVEVDDPHAMHIDATLLPLRHGLMVFNPERVTEAALRKHSILEEWELVPCPCKPAPRSSPPRFMTSGWLLMNVLSLDEKRVIVEEDDTQFADFLQQRGFTSLRLPFKHVHSIGGSFHCATVDLVRV